MPKRTRSDSPTKNCELADCERPMRAKGLCSVHYKARTRELTGRSHHKQYDRTCVTCGTQWQTPRPEARFCTAKCKGVHLSTLNRRSSPLPDDHPVILLITEAKARAKAEAAERRKERARSTVEWRTARECPGCACIFTPLYTPNAITCSRRCSRRMGKQRRRAREVGARGQFTWSEFMRIARKFDYCCAYCGDKPDRLDPDHVVPLSRGGSNAPSNLLPACVMCNSSKGAMTLDEWGIWLRARGLPTRRTAWTSGDPRYVHLTDTLLAISPAA